MFQQLSININDETARQIRLYSQHRGVNVTETVRHAVALLDMVDRHMRNGWTVVIKSGHDGTERELIPPQPNRRARR